MLQCQCTAGIAEAGSAADGGNACRYMGFCLRKKDCYVEAADITCPIVVTEIAPDYRNFVPDIPENDWTSRGYVCIDGLHCIEKARRLGIKTIPAGVIRMEQHIPFLHQYVECWNGKLKNRTEDALRLQQRTTK